MPGYMLIANTAQRGITGSGVTTPAINTTGANLLVVGGQSAAPTDSFGNTWTATPAVGNSRLYYCVNPTVGAAHTFSNSTSLFPITVSAWSGARPAPLDQDRYSVTGAFTTITPPQPGALIIIGLLSNGTLGRISAPFITLDQIPAATGTHHGGQAYWAQGDVLPFVATWPATGTAVWANLAVFLPEPGVPARSAVLPIAMSGAVELGPPDSAGPGFRTLRVPN